MKITIKLIAQKIFIRVVMRKGDWRRFVTTKKVGWDVKKN
jgi:hypothetical protein